MSSKKRTEQAKRKFLRNEDDDIVSRTVFDKDAVNDDFSDESDGSASVVSNVEASDVRQAEASVDVDEQMEDARIPESLSGDDDSVIEIPPDDVGNTGRTGQATASSRRPTPRGPRVPPPRQEWGPGRGVANIHEQRLANRGIGRLDAMSGTGGRTGEEQGSKKRRNESAHDQGRGSKAMKVFDTSTRTAKSFRMGGVQAERSGYTGAVTGTKLLGGGPQTTNYFGQYAGEVDAFAAKTTGKTLDAAASIFGAYNEAEKRSATREVLTVCMPINRKSAPDGSSRVTGGDVRQNVQETMESLGFRGTRKWGKKFGSSSRGSSSAPRTQRGRETVMNAAAARHTAGAREKTPPGDKGKQAETIDVTPETENVDRPKASDEVSCNVCGRSGHTTGRCSQVTSTAHGDTNTDPFCDMSTSCRRKRPGQEPHALQGPQRDRQFRVACPKLNGLWVDFELLMVWHVLVIERRRMPPLAVFTTQFCFIELTLRVSDTHYGGEMPPEMESVWPYTKADAVKYEEQCDRFWQIGIENMPPGELEGVTMDEIRRRYRNGDIKRQIRYTTSDQRKAALMPAKLDRDDDVSPDEEARRPGAVDGGGDTVMGGGEAPTGQGTLLSRTYKPGAADTADSSDDDVPGFDGPGLSRRGLKGQFRLPLGWDGEGSSRMTTMGGTRRRRHSEPPMDQEEIHAEAEAEDRAAEQFERRMRDLKSRLPKMVVPSQSNAVIEDPAEATEQVARPRRDLKGRLPKMVVPSQGNNVTKDPADAASQKKTTATKLRQQPAASGDAPAIAAKDGQRIVLQESNTVIDRLSKQADGKGKSTGDDADQIDRIDGPQDLPDGLWGVWGQSRAQKLLDNPLVLLHKAIENAGKTGFEPVTQTEVYDYLLKRRLQGHLPEGMAEIFDATIQQWEWLDTPQLEVWAKSRE